MNKWNSLNSSRQDLALRLQKTVIEIADYPMEWSECPATGTVKMYDLDEFGCRLPNAPEDVDAPYWIACLIAENEYATEIGELKHRHISPVCPPKCEVRLLRLGEA